MIGSIGDVVEDIVVRLNGEINHASDTPAKIEHRRGGSAATVATVAAHLCGSARFIGQVGDDDAGRRIRDALAERGVEHVGPIAGETGTIVVLVDPTGERTMLTDPGDSANVEAAEAGWLDGLGCLHVPFYSLAKAPLDDSTIALCQQASGRGLPVSIDASSSAVLRSFGPERARSLMASLSPTIVFCNEDEAAVLEAQAGPEAFGASVLVIKHGAEPAELLLPNGVHHLLAPPTPHKAVGTTGAGDSFAAGFLVSFEQDKDPVAAVLAGHESALAYLKRVAAGQPS